MVNSMLAVDSGTRFRVSGIDTSVCTLGVAAKLQITMTVQDTALYTQEKHAVSLQLIGRMHVQQCMHIRHVTA